MSLKIVFRVDSSAVIGSGHVMRCLTLAQMLRERGASCAFVCRDFPGNFSEKIVQAGFELVLLKPVLVEETDSWLGADELSDAAETLNALRDMNPDWIVADHYNISETWQKRVSEAISDLKILVIDDLADRMHRCDLLLDLSPGRSLVDYDGLVANDTKMLIGLHYALLRSEFVNVRQTNATPKTAPGEPAEVLITFGGADNTGVLQTTFNALEALPATLKANFTIIGERQGLKIPNELSERIQWLNFEPDMATRISHSDLVVSAAGGTSWERCCLGIPAVVLMVAENQRLNFEAIEEAEAGICVETEAAEIAAAIKAVLQDQRLYSNIAANSWNLCDGNGTKRVADELFARSMSIRRASINDAKFVYDARYSAGAEQFYKNPEKPDFKAHLDWFGRALENPAYQLLIVQIGNSRVAHVRLDVDAFDSDAVEIGIALAEDFRGQGLGRSVIKSTIENARKSGFRVMTAEVHPLNVSSKRVFEAAGFTLTQCDNDGLLHYKCSI